MNAASIDGGPRGAAAGGTPAARHGRAGSVGPSAAGAAAGDRTAAAGRPATAGSPATAGRPTAGRPGKDRTLWPKEHGAYGQLALPVVAALALGRPTLASILLVIGAAAAFVAHEPLLVALGLRGARARREHGGRAARLGVGCAGLALAAGLGGWSLGGLGVIFASLLPLAFVVALLPLVVAGRERTTGGEVLAGAALAAASIPVAVAGGVSLGSAALVWGAWIVAFTASTAAVRLVIARHKTGARDRSLLAVTGAATAGLVALAAATPIGLAAAPMVLAGWWLIARPPHPRNLRRVGWTLVACSTATAVLAVAIGRLTDGW